MNKCSDAIYIRLTMEEAVVLNNLAREVGTSPTNFAREILKAGLANTAGDFLVRVSPVEEVVSRVLDERLNKFENRLASLTVKGWIASLEAEGFALNVLRQVLSLRKLAETDINNTMAKIKETVYKSAKEKIRNRQ